MKTKLDENWFEVKQWLPIATGKMVAMYKIQINEQTTGKGWERLPKESMLQLEALLRHGYLLQTSRPKYQQ